MCAADARHLLVVFHSRSGGTQALADAAIAGATSDDIDEVEVRVKRAFDATVDDVRWCDGIVLGTPENFGYMSGALKDFFERIYYALLEETRGLPYALFVKGGHDGEGAIRSVERIVTGLGLEGGARAGARRRRPRRRRARTLPRARHHVRGRPRSRGLLSADR